MEITTTQWAVRLRKDFALSSLPSSHYRTNGKATNNFAGREADAENILLVRLLTLNVYCFNFDRFLILVQHRAAEKQATVTKQNNEKKYTYKQADTKVAPSGE